MLDNIILIFYYHIVKVTLFVSFVFIKLSLRIIWFQKAIFLKLATNNHLKLTKPLFSNYIFQSLPLIITTINQWIEMWLYGRMFSFQCTTAQNSYK